ncbi:hypothetical protein [Methylobacterium sp. ARG-1]|uniref:hypothetical protein n=1 Tax=Methylobacterium sp. ARG-1 TaxID=1692501 RepID=UPI00068198AE|nr:hypothetical protein [Methylobacterium sp. ARG-1]KNY21066.1 hypothetical protein AKJ13_18880 [Methylobacterium sp. ARG-1]
MPRPLQDDPYLTISLSIDSDLLARLNTAARLSPEVASRSELVRDLLNLSLDILLEPVETLPYVVAALREHYASDPETS